MSAQAQWGAIFDWDGVIIDSSKAHEESWERLAREVAKPLPPDHFIKGFGRKNDFIIPEILGWTHDPKEVQQFSFRKEEIYRQVVQERGQTALPGVRTWLEKLRTAGVPCAIGSSTHRANIDLLLGLVGLTEYFSAVVTGEDVQQGKPHPEVFLKAAERISRAAHDCVVFEDAHVGIMAARAGGMRVIGVATTHSLEELDATDRAVRWLDEIDLAEVAGWFGKAKPTGNQR